MVVVVVVVVVGLGLGLLLLLVMGLLCVMGLAVEVPLLLSLTALLAATGHLQLQPLLFLGSGGTPAGRTLRPRCVRGHLAGAWRVCKCCKSAAA